MFPTFPVFLVPQLNPLSVFCSLTVFRKRGTKNTGYVWLILCYGLVKKLLFGKVMVGNYFVPGGPIYGNLELGQVYKIMITSKHVCISHHIHRFLSRYLVLKMSLNTGQTPGTMAVGEKEKMAKSEGAIETF